MPSDPLRTAVVAESLLGVGQVAQAEGMLADALAEHPDSPALLTGLSAVLRTKGDLRGAEQAARAAIAQAPTWTPPMLRLTFALLLQGRADEAAAVAQSVITMEPDESSAWAYLALAGVDRRTGADRQVARRAYSRAIELAPGNSTFRSIGAIVERAYGDLEGARRLVEEGLSIDPQSGPLLALRAEYAPVSQQPELLVDVLTANPTDDSSRELLDAAVTWERRVALTPALVLPVLVAAVVPAGGIATGALTLLSLALGALVVRRYRLRLAVLPAGYLAVRAAAARGTVAIRALVLVCAAAAAAGAVLAWTAPGTAEALLALSVLAGGGAVLAGLPDDQRVLATARRHSGRTRGSTAWRYGGLRQELTLWTALVAGAVGVVAVVAAGGTEAVGAAAAATAWATAAVVVLLLVEAGWAGVNAPHGYLRRLGARYRFVVGAGLTVGLLVLGLAALAPGTLDSGGGSPADRSEIDLPGVGPRTPLPTVEIPSFTVPTFPSLTVPPGSTATTGASE